MGNLILALIAGVAAGAFTARSIVRKELREFAERGLTRPASPLPGPPPVPERTKTIATTPAPPAVPAPVEITPEIIAVLTAAVAAFLGKRAKIRSIQPRGGAYTSNVWAQQGRVFVQASHNLPVHR